VIQFERILATVSLDCGVTSHRQEVWTDAGSTSFENASTTAPRATRCIDGTIPEFLLSRTELLMCCGAEHQRETGKSFGREDTSRSMRCVDHSIQLDPNNTSARTENSVNASQKLL
jgi:hypothetical protein